MKLLGYEIVKAAAHLRGEIGSPGTGMSPSSGGAGTAMLTEDDYNPDLQGTKLYDEVDRMRMSDSQVKAAMSVIKLPILAADWHVESASDSAEDKRIAEWFEDQLTTKLYHSWDWVLRHILLHLDFGTMPFETVWEVQDDDEFKRPLVHLLDLAPRMPRTITEWRLDEHGRLAGVVQSVSTATSFKDVTIPVDKLLVFVNEQEGANYRGVSVLRAARKDWMLKERAQRANAIALEKRAAGIDIGTLAGSNQAQDKKTAAENVLMTVRNHERAYILETDDFKYRTQGIEGAVLDPLPTIQYHDLMILRGILAEFLAMGGGGGSLAMHRDKSSFFLMSLAAIAKQVTSTINRDLIPKWLGFNFPNADPPELTHSRLDRRDATVLAEALAKLIPAGVIKPDSNLEAEVRDMLEMPEAMEVEEEEPAPEPTPETNPDLNPDTDPDMDDLDPDPDADPLITGATRTTRASKPMARGQWTGFREVRTPSERVPDFIAMANGLDRAETTIVRGYGPVQKRQIDKLVDEAMKAIESGKPERLESINVPYKAEAATAFSGPLEDLYRQGQAEVRKEFTRMRRGQSMPVRLASPLDPADDDAVKAWLRARSRSIALVLAERLRGSMIRHGLDMMKRGDNDRNSLLARLTALSDRDIKREATQSTSEALNIGRESVAEQNKDLIQAVEYSALMDSGTCDECGILDGTTFELGSEPMRQASPPYRNCSGFGNPRCRCVFIYTLSDEAEV